MTIKEKIGVILGEIIKNEKLQPKYKKFYEEYDNQIIVNGEKIKQLSDKEAEILLDKLETDYNIYYKV